MSEAYKDLWKSYRLYWRLYGGWRAVLTSPYLHLALLVTALCSPIWWDNTKGAVIWPSASVNILPNLMGFSIAGMAIFLAFSNESTMKAVTEEGEPESYFVIALFLGFIGLHYQFHALSAAGVFFLVYALAVAPAMAMQLLHTARIINAAESLPAKPPGENE